MYKYKSMALSQNFFRDEGLVNRLIVAAKIKPGDTVLDIGAGYGIISAILEAAGAKVLAVEIDPLLVKHLKWRFANNINVKIYNLDFNKFSLPKYPYKVFTNLPFSRTSEFVTKLLFAKSSPEEAHLVVQKEAAQKFSGTPRETQFSVLLKPFFYFEIIYNFKKSDFIPQPSVETVLLKITKRPTPLISQPEKMSYEDFVRYAFNTWKKDLKVGLKKVISYRAWHRLAKDNKFSLHAKPTDLTFDQWLKIYKFISLKKLF